jgi:hypothetical protein
MGLGTQEAKNPFVVSNRTNTVHKLTKIITTTTYRFLIMVLGKNGHVSHLQINYRGIIDLIESDPI